MLADGHILIEDVPGVGKTTLAKAIARSVGADIQARPVHAGPAAESDVTGVTIFNQKTREFEFREGPVMAQIVLADRSQTAPRPRRSRRSWRRWRNARSRLTARRTRCRNRSCAGNPEPD